MDTTRNCYEAYMRVPEYEDPIRVRWYTVPRPAPGSYELTDYSSSDWDGDPKSDDPNLGEQSTTRNPFQDWRDCTPPPWTVRVRSSGAGTSFPSGVSWVGLNSAPNFFDLPVDPTNSDHFGPFIHGTVLFPHPPYPVTTTRPGSWEARIRSSRGRAVLTLKVTVNDPLGPVYVEEFTGVRSPVTVPLTGSGPVTPSPGPGFQAEVLGWAPP